MIPTFSEFRRKNISRFVENEVRPIFDPSFVSSTMNADNYRGECRVETKKRERHAAGITGHLTYYMHVERHGNIFTDRRTHSGDKKRESGMPQAELDKERDGDREIERERESGMPQVHT